MKMEEFVFTSEFMTEFELDKPKENKVRAIVLKNNISKIANGCDENVMGLSLINWVKNSLLNIEISEVNLDDKINPEIAILPFIKDEDYTIVLFSDTPLITNTDVFDALEYAQTKMLDYCKLPRGFIVKSQNFKQKKIILSAEPNFLDEKNYFCVFDNKTLSQAKEILKKRIIDKHLKNKVIIDDASSVYIENNVEIGSNTKIYSFNSLKGKTIIGKNVCLLEHNTIEDSVIEDNCTIEFSKIVNSKIKKCSIVGPFKFISK